MRLLFSSGLFLACCTISFCQDFDKYKTILPQGIIPKDFTEQSSVKVANEVTTLSGAKAKERKTKKKFVLESTYSMDDFLASGSVLFNDEVSVYLDQVLKEILKPSPALQSKVRIYAVKSPSVNAFTTNNGMIFVNMGLLARLDNEAQLAFILSHEVVHYQKAHVINSYVTNIEIDKARGDYRKLSVSEKGFAKSSFSKELEMEADLAGADLYQKSEYAKDSVDKMFDVLLKADLPLAWTPFNKQLFESGTYIFPDSLSLFTPEKIVINEDYDDSKSSHPNIKKRRAAIAEKFKSGKDGSDFRISKETFFKLRKIARYELCRLYLLDHRYEEAIALATSLQKENPLSTYLNEITVKALYGIARQALGAKETPEREAWGDAAALASFIKKQSPYELNVLAIRQLYKFMESTPDNKSVVPMLNDLIRAFADNNMDVKNKFLRTPSQEPISQLAYPYTQYAFIDFKDNNAFFQLFDKQVSLVEKNRVVEWKSTKKKKKEKAPSVKAAKIVVVHPLYKKVDKRKKQRTRHVEAEEVIINMNDYITEAAKRLDMKVDVINPNKISRADVVLMQSNSLLNDWIDERMRADDENMISPIQEEMIALADKYKTDHFMWMGGVTVKAKKRGWVVLGLGALLVPSLTPWMVKEAFTNRGATLYFALGFNVRTQQIELIDLRQMEMNDNRFLLQSNIYYTLSKLKK
jgi:hypothetical protein